MPMPDRWGRPADLADLAATFRHFATNRAGNYAPRYARLAAGIANDPDLLALAACARPGQSPPDLLLAAVHYLLARDRTHRLARYYPTLVTAPATGDSFPAFRDFCLSRADQLRELMQTRRVQTNEVRRCTFLLPAVMHAAALAKLPLAMIEVGASAGLNLHLDRYRYDYSDGHALGDPASSVQLGCELRGRAQPPLDNPVPTITWRAGIDINPLNPADPNDAAWLRALVWADHRERARLLDHALTVAADQHHIRVFAGDAAHQLSTAIAAAPDDAAICVMHCAFLAHLPPLERERFEILIPVLSTIRPIYWIKAEPRPDPTDPRLRVAVCERGRTQAEWPLGHYHPHGAWLEWTAPAST